MATFTEFADVERRWLVDEPIPAEAKVTAAIEDAEDALVAAVPDLAQRVNDGRVPVGRVHRIVARLVIEKVTNPRGLRTLQTSTGPFSDTHTYGGDRPGQIVVSQADVNELLGRRRQRAFSINTAQYAYRSPVTRWEVD